MLCQSAHGHAPFRHLLLHQCKYTVQILKAGIFDKRIYFCLGSTRFVDSAPPTTCQCRSQCHSATMAHSKSISLNRKLALVGIIPNQNFFSLVWSGCQFFYLCRSWKRREFDYISEYFMGDDRGKFDMGKLCLSKGIRCPPPPQKKTFSKDNHTNV